MALDPIHLSQAWADSDNAGLPDSTKDEQSYDDKAALARALSALGGTSQRRYESQLVTLTASATSTVEWAYEPETVIVVHCQETVGVLLDVMFGELRSNPDMRLGPKGRMRVPGRGNRLTLRNQSGSATTLVLVAALRGWGPQPVELMF